MSINKIKEKNNKAQFYLLAAIIIIAIIIGFAAVMNYVRKSGEVKIYDLGEELGIESGYVIDYGVYKKEDISQKLEDFTKLYSEYVGEGKALYYVFGNKQKIAVAAYKDVDVGTITAVIGGGIIKLELEQKAYEIGREDLPIGSESETIKVKIKAKSDEWCENHPGHEDCEESIYEFKLKPGENFYFVITQKIGEEQYIVEG